MILQRKIWVSFLLHIWCEKLIRIKLPISPFTVTHSVSLIKTLFRQIYPLENQFPRNFCQKCTRSNFHRGISVKSTHLELELHCKLFSRIFFYSVISTPHWSSNITWYVRDHNLWNLRLYHGFFWKISVKTTSLVKSFTIKLISRNNSQVIQKFRKLHTVLL